MNVPALKPSRESAEILVHPAHSVGGFIIDDAGREVAITEQMIQQACEALDRQWVAAQPRFTH
ncbi:PA1571 family protein [Halopseudomonas sp.]|uniref:PA1571 family protein n=1 Tax=Halopseudomonas sp. TaxID=2901191 RepID=UPI00311D60FE